MSPSPFAIPISFTANYPLETCKQILNNSEVIPGVWERVLSNGPKMTFNIKIISVDRYEFEAERRTSRIPVIGQGYLERLNDQATTVTGYADAPTFFYWYLALIFLIGFPASIIFFSDTAQNIFFKLGVATLFFGGLAVLNLVMVREQAKKLAHIIETKLTSG